MQAPATAHAGPAPRGSAPRDRGQVARFPAVRERLQGTPAETEARGSGPFRQGVRRRHADRVALVGDAAGYLDAITGEGLTLAFESAAALAEVQGAGGLDRLAASSQPGAVSLAGDEPSRTMRPSRSSTTRCP